MLRKNIAIDLGTANTLFKKAFLIVWPKEAQDHFEKEEGPEGSWPSLSAVYAARRAKEEGAGYRLLQIRGKLRQKTAFRPQVEELPLGIRAFSPVPWSGYLDEGTNKMPARPFMWLGGEAQQILVDTIMEGLLKQVGGTD